MDEERVGHVEVAEQARVAHEPGDAVGRTEQVDDLVDLFSTGASSGHQVTPKSQ